MGQNYGTSDYDYQNQCKENTFQDSEAKMKTEEDHAEGKPSSETLNKAKVKDKRRFNITSLFYT